MAANGSSDDVFKRNNERRTRVSSFADDSTEPAVNSTWFVRPVAKFIRNRIKD